MKMHKQELREYYKKIRQEIPMNRHEEAKEHLYSYLISIAKDYDLVLSYSSLEYELDLEEVNAYLCKHNKLILPKVHGQNLELYHVQHLDHLTQGKYKNLEPRPSECKRIEPKQIQLIIVPALCADRQGNRLGYGLGYYDKLLEKMPQTYSICPIFREQMSETKLVVQKHDIAMSEVKIF